MGWENAIRPAYQRRSDAQGGSVEFDPLWANVVLRLPYQAGDGATGAVDVSGRHVVSPNGDVQTDTAQKKFRVSSRLFDGTGDYDSAPDSADWNFGAGDWSISAWGRFNALPAGSGIMQVASQWSGSGSATQAWAVGIRENGGNYDMVLYRDQGAGTVTLAQQISGGLSTNTWYYFRYERFGNTIYFYVDGVRQGSGSAMSDTLRDVAQQLTIGSEGASFSFWNGWLQDVDIVKGASRNSGAASFAVPTDLLPQIAAP